MRRWGLLLSASAALVGFLALTNPTPGQLYNSLLPRIQDAARRTATAPAAEQRAIESAGTFFGPAGAAIAGGIVGEAQASKEADFVGTAGVGLTFRPASALLPSINPPLILGPFPVESGPFLFLLRNERSERTVGGL